MVGSLGGVSFVTSDRRVLTFTGLNQKVSGRYASHEPLAGKPQKEYLGEALRSGGLTIELRRDLGVEPESAMRTLQGYSAAGKVVYLSLGGRLVGKKWNITDVAAEYDQITNRGRVDVITLSVSLEEYN